MTPIPRPTFSAPRPRWWTLLLLPFLLAADTDDAGVPLARAEGALASVREEAATMSLHARKVVESGRFGGIGQLQGDALALHRQVLSAKLAVDVLAKLDSP